MSWSEERRDAHRLLRDETVVVKIIASPENPQLLGITVECSTVDISSTGLRLLVDGQVVSGSHLALEVDMTDSEDCYFLVGEVMWARETEAEGVYLVGVQLEEGSNFELDRWRQLFA